MTKNTLEIINIVATSITSIAAAIGIFYSFKTLNLSIEINEKQKDMNKIDRLVKVIESFETITNNIQNIGDAIEKFNYHDWTKFSSSIGQAYMYIEAVKKSNLFTSDDSDITELNIRLKDLRDIYENKAITAIPIHGICYNISLILEKIKAQLITRY